MDIQRGRTDHPNWPRRCVGHMEREPRRLQLRFVLFVGEGVCDVEIDEEDHAVTVYGFICAGEDEEPVDHSESCDCPCTCIWIDRSETVVIDGHSGRQVPYRNVWEEIAAQLAVIASQPIHSQGRLPVLACPSRRGTLARSFCPRVWSLHVIASGASRPHAHPPLEAQPRRCGRRPRPDRCRCRRRRESADDSSIPGTESQQALDLFRDHSPAFAGADSTIVFSVDSGTFTDPRTARRSSGRSTRSRRCRRRAGRRSVRRGRRRCPRTGGSRRATSATTSSPTSSTRRTARSSWRPPTPPRRAASTSPHAAS